jgi:hypothetical protein
MYPDFVGIGAQKCGTTWLHQNLRAHPEVWLPPVKELHYFDQYAKDTEPYAAWRRLRGKRPFDERWRRQVWRRVPRQVKRMALGDLLWDIRYFMLTPGDGWYASLFRPRKGQLAGEITPAYSLLGEDGVAHFRRLMPEAKLLFFVRNPIERAWSHAVMDLDAREGRVAEDPEAEKRILRHFNRPDSRRQASYLRVLDLWGRHYPEDSFFVGILEDVRFSPGELLPEVFRFLGVDPSVRPREMNRTIHSRSVGKIPTRIASHLAAMYREEIRELNDRFGGYASFWLYCADRLTADPPAEQFLPYPLWESTLWQEWINGHGSFVKPPPGRFRLQSGPLSRVVRAADGG